MSQMLTANQAAPSPLRALPRYPSLYQVNTRVWLTELSRTLGKRATLDDIPDAELDRWQALGFDFIWLLSVWQTGPAAQRISRENPHWRSEFQATLPDLQEEDIPGSGFAIAAYTVHKNLGGDAALARLRKRLAQRDLRLMLDFVPNHMAPDHPWVQSHTDYFVAGTEEDLQRAPQNYTRVALPAGQRILAYGRDPYFSGWPDTLQLNYANPAAQTALIGELTRIATQCDGLRCDMAMLVLPEVFLRTWGLRSQPFWPQATAAIRAQFPDFCLLAEAYWDLEWTLQQQGFDYAYDKRLYDRLHPQAARPIREHLCAGLDFQDHLARFLENHDEPRAATTFSPEVHPAAAIITFLAPGLRFFHQGQLEGKRKRISPHLGRGPDEPIDTRIQAFYQRLLELLQQPLVRDGHWQLLPCLPAWEGNWTSDCFVAFAWDDPRDERLVVVVNYAPHASQCHVRLPWDLSAAKHWRFIDWLGDDLYDRAADPLSEHGWYVDLAPWQCGAYSLTRLD